MFYIWNMYISPEIMLCIVHNSFLNNLEIWRKFLVIPNVNIYDSIDHKKAVNYIECFSKKITFNIKISEINKVLQYWVNLHFLFNSYSDKFIIFDNNKDFNEWLCFTIKNKVMS